MGIAAGDPSGLASLSVASLASQGLVKEHPFLRARRFPCGAPLNSVSAHIELTAPFFLNGGQATLEQVVDFYSRGGTSPLRIPILSSNGQASAPGR